MKKLFILLSLIFLIIQPKSNGFPNTTVVNDKIGTVYHKYQVPANVALNKPTTCQSYQTGHGSAKANDSDATNNSYWSADPYSQFWQVDLGNIYNVTTVVIRNFVDGKRSYKYGIYASTDKINYVKIAEKTNTNIATTAGDTYKVNVNTRYLKVFMTYNSVNTGVHISDFKAYGVIAGTTTYSINASAGTGGTISPSGVTPVNLGGTQTYNIVSNIGYKISGVLVDNVSVGTVSTYTFNNISANHVIAATFIAIPNIFTITSSTGTGGTITPIGTVIVNQGASQTYAIIPNAGNKIADVLVDNVSVGAVNTYGFNNISANHVITATFAPITYVITSSTGTGGTISPLGTTIINQGTLKTYTITPNSGYKISNVLVDNVSVGAVNTYTFNNVSTNHVITATFTVVSVSYTITSNAGMGGAISPSGIVTVTNGSSQTYTIKANSGYQIYDVLVDNVSVGVVSTYTFNNINGNHVIAVNFAMPATTTSYTNPFSVIEGAKISHDQYYPVPPSGYVSNNDYLGQVVINCTDSVFIPGINIYSFSIEAGNQDNAFKISTTGMLQINDYSKLTSGSNRTLNVAIVDNGLTLRKENINCYIRVASSDSCKFIVFGGANGNGSFSSPWNSCRNATFLPGYYYFIARGLTSPTGDMINVQNPNNPQKWIRIAAFKQGARPILSGAGYTAALWVGYPHDGATSSEVTKKVIVCDVDVEGYTASGAEPVYICTGTQNVQLHRIKVNGANGNACIYLKQYHANHWYVSHILVQDCEVYNNKAYHGLKNEASYVFINNLWGSGNPAHFLDLDVWGSGNVGHYIYGNNNGTAAVIFRHSRGELRWFVLKGTSGIEISQPTEPQYHPDSCLIADGYMECNEGYYGGGITISSDAANTGHANYNTIRHVIFNYRGSPSATVAGVRSPSATTYIVANDRNTVDGCIFYGRCSGIYINNPLTTNFTIKNCLFYNLSYYGVFINSIGTGGKIYNNTAHNNVNNDFQLNSGVAEIRNNAYDKRNTTTGWSPSTNNYLFSTGNPFQDVNNNIYYPANGSGLINTGFNYGGGKDIMGTTVPQNGTTDIGAFEYVTTP